MTPLYRPRSWNKEERKNKKRLKKSSWYRPVVLFVPATPEAELANQAREVVEGEGKRLDIKVKVVERGGPEQTLTNGNCKAKENDEPTPPRHNKGNP